MHIELSQTALIVSLEAVRISMETAIISEYFVYLVEDLATFEDGNVVLLNLLEVTDTLCR